MAIVEFRDVSRVYRNGEHEQRALDHVDLSLEEGKFIVVLGPSGAGKSTLLNLLGGLDSPTEGTIYVGGKDISTLTANELAEYRAASVGFVFQSYNLIPTLTVIENVALVKEIAPDPLSSHDMLKAVGLADHIHQFPSELSGGEQQRVSIARALAKNPHGDRTRHIRQIVGKQGLRGTSHLRHGPAHLAGAHLIRKADGQAGDVAHQSLFHVGGRAEGAAVGADQCAYIDKPGQDSEQDGHPAVMHDSCCPGKVRLYLQHFADDTPDADEGQQRQYAAQRRQNERQVCQRLEAVRVFHQTPKGRR